MANAGEVKVHITGDMRDLQLALRQAETATSRAAGAMRQQMGGAFRAMGRAAQIAGVAMAASIGLAIRESANAVEIRSRFDAVFRHLSEESRQWAQETASNISRSSIALEQYMSTFQDTFVPLGASREAAAAFSQQLTTLAVDLASFNNEAEPDTVRALQSAIVGNHETMRRYGVIINEAALSQELLRMGIRGGTREATALQAAQARLNLIMDGTSDAQGDAARTSESAANQWRAFTAETRDAAVAVGDSFMPAALELLQWLRDVLPRLQEAGVWLGNVASGIRRALGGGVVFEPITEADIREQRDAVDELYRHYQEIADRGAQFGDAVNYANLRQYLPDEAIERILESADPYSQAAEELDSRFITLVLRLREVQEEARRAAAEAEDLGNAGRPATIRDEDFRAAQESFVPEWAPEPRDIQTIEEMKAAFEALEPVGVEAFTETMRAADEMSRAFEDIADGALKALEEAFVDFIRTGRLEISNFVDYIIEQFARLAFQEWIGGPMENIMGNIISGIGSVAGLGGGSGSGDGLAIGKAAAQMSGRPMTVVNIDARYATEGTAQMIQNAFASEGPKLVRTSVDASLSSMSEMQQATRAF